MENTPQENQTKPQILLLTDGKKSHSQTVENPYKADIFETYVIWKSLPALLKNPPPQKQKDGSTIKPDPRQFAEAQGIDDEDLLELIMIPSQTAFAERFSLNQSTLVQWNKTIKERPLLEDTKKWARSLMNNAVMSLYAHAMKGGNPFNFKLFFQIIGEFQEKAIMEHKLTPIQSIEFIEISHDQVKTETKQ